MRKADIETALGRDVSRETLDRLEHFEAAVLKWSPKINLIARNTYSEVWDRHIMDSVQIAALVKDRPSHWSDLGSGGGLPGIVLACLGAEIWPEAHFAMIESDARKSAFLTLISREMGLDVTVTRARIEAAAPSEGSHVSARALAPLPLLLDYCHRHLAQGGTALLPKGRNHTQELDAAAQSWHFQHETHVSRIDPDSVILVVRNLRPMEDIR